MARMNDDLLDDLKEWAESYDAVEVGADGILYAAINRIEQLETALRFYAQSSTYQHMGVQMSGTSTRPCDTDMGTRARSALKGEKKDG
jgi:hypothetical protein